MQARCAITVAAGVVLFTFGHCVADDIARGATNSTEDSRAASRDGWRTAKKVASEESRVEGRQELANRASGPRPTVLDSPLSSGPQPSTLNPRPSSNPQPSSYFVAAQSPEDDRYSQSVPSWTYPRRPPATAPVPDYRGDSDYASRSSQYDTRLAQAPRQDDWSASAAPRFPGAPRPQTDSWTRPGAARQPDSLRQSDYWNQPNSNGQSDPAARAGYQAPYHSSPFDSAGPSCPTDPYAPAAPYGEPPAVPFNDPCDPSNFYNCRYTWNEGYFFGVVDWFRFADDGARLGARIGFNWGLPLVDDDTGLGIQAGYSGGIAEAGGHQFATAGVFYRGDMRQGSAFNIGGVIDWMQDNGYDTDVWQIRAKTSVTLDANNEIGVWGALSARDDDKDTGQSIQSVDQINLFYRLLLLGGWDLSPFVGWRSDPSGVALGGDLYVPLSDFWGFIAGGHYAFKGDTWEAYTGLVLHWGPRARQDFIGQDRHLPYLPVADNSSMTLFLDR